MSDGVEQHLGTFRVKGRQFSGAVNLKGDESRLELYADTPFHISGDDMRAIRGVTTTAEKITVCNAIGAEVSGTRSYHGTHKHFASLSPHYVAIGPRFLKTDRKVISRINFTTTGAISIFYDNGAFGWSDFKNVNKLMPNWAKKDRRKIQFSKVFYYVDRGPMICVQFQNIKIEAANGISYTLPNPRGIDLKNEVRISFSFKKPVVLRDALRDLYQFQSFCEIVSQTKHCVKNIYIWHKNIGEREPPIRLCSCHAETEGGPNTDYRDNLVSGGFHKKEFETILFQWMRSHRERGSARNRVVQGTRQGRHYSIDRLVGAANAFDLLPMPESVKPKLPVGVLKTLAKLTRDAKGLKQPYRDQILNNLHRVKGLSLRQKIEARYRILNPQLRERFPEMEIIIDHCVRTRNYFVHGTKPKLTVTKTHDLIFFLTDTLEFIFIAAELTECGWKFARWLEEANMGTLREYVRNYDLMLKELKGEVDPVHVEAP